MVICKSGSAFVYQEAEMTSGRPLLLSWAKRQSKQSRLAMLALATPTIFLFD